MIRPHLDYNMTLAGAQWALLYLCRFPYGIFPAMLSLLSFDIPFSSPKLNLEDDARLLPITSERTVAM